MPRLPPRRRPFEDVSARVDELYQAYMDDEITLEEAELGIAATLILALWSEEEFDEEVISRSENEPGCRKAAAVDTN